MHDCVLLRGGATSAMCINTNSLKAYLDPVHTTVMQTLEASSGETLKINSEGAGVLCPVIDL